MRIRSMVLVGCGGTGSWAAEPLARLLATHPEGCAPEAVVLVDGDHFEVGNAARQSFGPAGLSKPKAVVMAEALADKGLPVRAVPQYIDGMTLRGLLVDAPGTPADKGVNLIVLAVDNDATRKSVLDALDNEPAPFVTLLPGNTDHSVMVTLYGRLMGTTIGQDPRQMYENVREPADRLPGGGCSALLASTPQILAANFAAAMGCVLATTRLLDSKPVFRGWNGDLDSQRFLMAGTPQGVPNHADLRPLFQPVNA